jgi:hypothetical protein
MCLPKPLIIQSIEQCMNQQMHRILGYGDDYKLASWADLERANGLLQGEFAMARDRLIHKTWTEEIGGLHRLKFLVATL